MPHFYLYIWVFLHIRVPFWIMMHHKPSIFARKERACSTTATTRGRNGWPKDEGGGDRDRIWGDWRWTDQWSEKVQESQHLHTLIPPQSFSVWQTAHRITLRTHMRTVTIQDNSLEIWTNTFQQNYPSMLNNWFQNKTKNVFSSLYTVRLDMSAAHITHYSAACIHTQLFMHS